MERSPAFAVIVEAPLMEYLRKVAPVTLGQFRDHASSVDPLEGGGALFSFADPDLYEAFELRVNFSRGLLAVANLGNGPRRRLFASFLDGSKTPTDRSDRIHWIATQYSPSLQ